MVDGVLKNGSVIVDGLERRVGFLDCFTSRHPPACFESRPHDHTPVFLTFHLLSLHAHMHSPQHSLIPELDKEVENYKDRNAYKWWQQQNISGGGVPSNVVPNDTWSLIPTFSFTGRMFLPDRSISIGPLYLAGNCLDSGTRMRCVTRVHIPVAFCCGVCTNSSTPSHARHWSGRSSLVVSRTFRVVILHPDSCSCFLS